jgi:hypothetical protein
MEVGVITFLKIPSLGNTTIIGLTTFRQEPASA